MPGMEGHTRPRYCLGCDYPLDGLAEFRCPECGRAFDPADPRTVNGGRPLGRLGRWLMRPAGWPTLLPAAAASAVTMIATTAPTGWRLVAWPGVETLSALASPDRDLPLLYPYRVLLSAAVTLWLLTAALWGLRSLAAVAAALCLRQPPRRLFARPLRWTAVPLLAAVTAALVWWDVPLRVGFALAKPGLAEAVELERDAADAFPYRVAPSGLSELVLVFRLERPEVVFPIGEAVVLQKDPGQGFVYDRHGFLSSRLLVWDDGFFRDSSLPRCEQVMLWVRPMGDGWYAWYLRREPIPYPPEGMMPPDDLWRWGLRPEDAERSDGPP
jgi:hypothetical protein